MANEQPPHPIAGLSDSRNPEAEVSAALTLSKHQLSATRRKEIDDRPELKLHLEEWGAQLKEDLLKIETYRTRCIAAKSELYQHMSFYILFQGVVFGALSNGSKLTCQTSLFPASLSFLASVATAVSVHSKLGYYEIEKLKFIKAEGLAKNLVIKINKLRNTGKEFKFEDIDEPSQTSRQKKRQDDEAGSQRKFYWAVMFFLVLFSLIILASCIFVPCFDTQKHKLRLCALHKCREFTFH